MKKLLYILPFLFLAQGLLASQTGLEPDEVYAAQPTFLKEFTVYPNPTSGQLTLTMETFGESMSLQLKVYSLIGQEMYSETISPFAGSKQISLDLSKFPKGIYMVEVSNGDRFKSKRVSVI